MSKMFIETLEVAGMKPALYGMRNPMNSWSKSDSGHCNEINCEGCTWDLRGRCDVIEDIYVVGENDLDLAKRLSKAGNEHCKYLRQIQVWANANMPRYWWSEADTYKFGTKNSCSTMHRLLHKTTEITLDDFEYDELDEDLMEMIIMKLQTIRLQYLKSTDKDERNRLLIRAKKILPESFLQLRTWNTNYAELKNMYHQRKHHRLKEEWVDVFCRWCESLPYFVDMCIDMEVTD